MFFKCEDFFYIEDYTVDTTPYACPSNIDTVFYELQITARKFFTCFNINHMKANPEKATF